MFKVNDYFIKNFKQSVEDFQAKVNAVPSIALAGGSGSGKSTTVSLLLGLLMRRLLGNNIKNVQSSKIRNQIIPVGTDLEETIMGIHFEESKIDLFMENSRNAIGAKIVAANGNLSDDDYEEIFNEIVRPLKSKAYDLRAMFDEFEEKEAIKEEIIRIIEVYCNIIVGEDDSEYCMASVVKEKQQKAKREGTKFSRVTAYEEEVGKRSECPDWDELIKVFKDISKKIKALVIKKIEGLNEIGVSTEFINNSYYLVIEEKNIKEMDEFMKYLYSSSGQDTVISYISYYTPMTDTTKQVFGRYYNIKPNAPIFSIHDLKGLELGEGSINETILEISKSIPDSLILFQRTNDIVVWYDKFVDTVKNVFPKLPVYGVFSFADVTVKNYLRSEFMSIDGPGTDVDINSEYYKIALKNSIKRLKDDLKPYCEKIEKNNIHAKSFFCSNIPDDVKEIDEMLVAINEEKLYDDKRMLNLMANICKRTKGQYKIIKTIGIDEVGEKIKVSINSKKLAELANWCVSQHNGRYLPEYFQYINKCVHWNTVYKWRAENRMGYGWTSDAKVYDNISIYIGSMCTGFISKDALINMLEFEFKLKGSNGEEGRIGEYLSHNLLVDIPKVKRELAKELSYIGMKDEFDRTYFNNALNLTYKKLTSVDYWEQCLETILNKYIQIELNKTFE